MKGGYFVRTYELWRYTTHKNDYGETIEEWNKLADVPGRAYLGRMNDAISASGEYGKIQWTFACSADTDVEVADQIRFDSRKLDVKAISVTSRGDRIEALCQEVQS